MNEGRIRKPLEEIQSEQPLISTVISHTSLYHHRHTPEAIIYLLLHEVPGKFLFF